MKVLVVINRHRFSERQHENRWRGYFTNFFSVFLSEHALFESRSVESWINSRRASLHLFWFSNEIYTNLGISNKKRPIYLVRKYISIFTQVSGPIKLEIEFHLFRSCSRCNWRHLCTWQLEIRYTLSGISDIQEGVSRWSCASIQHGYRVRYASNLFIIHSIFACWSLTQLHTFYLCGLDTCSSEIVNSFLTLPNLKATFRPFSSACLPPFLTWDSF